MVGWDLICFNCWSPHPGKATQYSFARPDGRVLLVLQLCFLSIPHNNRRPVQSLVRRSERNRKRIAPDAGDDKSIHRKRSRIKQNPDSRSLCSGGICCLCVSDMVVQTNRCSQITCGSSRKTAGSSVARTPSLKVDLLSRYDHESISGSQPVPLSMSFTLARATGLSALYSSLIHCRHLPW